ncbi:MAG TPA: 2-phospho-L-lactate guanylyltransferase [Gaiellaceae bacterium]|nr:2-phospho-L-lactate guanylyltransferase [Gaiellaceae bacterium]
MQVDALVPLKRLDYAKTRLASVLDPPTRVRVMRALLDHTLEQVKAAPSVASVTLVSSAVEAPVIAAEHGVAHFDDRALPWNDALAAAIAEAVEGDAVAIVSADVPLLTADDVEAYVAALVPNGAVIARATDAGTNGVAMHPAGAMRTTFGSSGSAALHAELAREAGLTPLTLDLEGMAHDLDTAADLEEVLRHAMSPELRDVLGRALAQ